MRYKSHAQIAVAIRLVDIASLLWLWFLLMICLAPWAAMPSNKNSFPYTPHNPLYAPTPGQFHPSIYMIDVRLFNLDRWLFAIKVAFVSCLKFLFSRTKSVVAHAWWWYCIGFVNHFARSFYLAPFALAICFFFVVAL